MKEFLGKLANCTNDFCNTYEVKENKMLIKNSLARIILPLLANYAMYTSNLIKSGI